MSEQFDDPYFSLDNGLEETRHVFLQGNDLPVRFCDGFHIAELGFGTGLNFLTTLQSWRLADVPGKLKFTSFEAFPMTVDDIARALVRFDELADLRAMLLESWAVDGGRIAVAPEVELEVVVGDARETLPDWPGRANAWYLDGFSPAKNPELWSDALLREVGLHTAITGTFATYTAAGFVRRALVAAGFDVKRVQGFGRKRHMAAGVLKQ